MNHPSSSSKWEQNGFLCYYLDLANFQCFNSESGGSAAGNGTNSMMEETRHLPRAQVAFWSLEGWIFEFE